MKEYSVFDEIKISVWFRFGVSGLGKGGVFFKEIWEVYRYYKFVLCFSFNLIIILREVVVVLVRGILRCYSKSCSFICLCVGSWCGRVRFGF